jgi:hypothetical protein
MQNYLIVESLLYMAHQNMFIINFQSSLFFVPLFTFYVCFVNMHFSHSIDYH